MTISRNYAQLSTHTLVQPRILYTASCNPAFDVAVLLNPTLDVSRKGTVFLQAFHAEQDTLNNDDDAEEDVDVDANYAWKTTLENGEIAKLDQEIGYIHPRPAESICWHSDTGNMLAVCYSNSRICLVDLHTGKICGETSLPSPTSQLYLLGWQDLAGFRKGKHNETLETIIEKLPDLVNNEKRYKEMLANAPKNHQSMMNPYLPSVLGGKVHVPQNVLRHKGFPRLPPSSSSAEDSSTTEAVAAIEGKVEQRSKHSLLMAGNSHSGKLEIFKNGSVHLGSIPLGNGTDIVAVDIVTPPPPTSSELHNLLFEPRHSTQLSTLISVPLPIPQDSDLPTTIKELLPAPPAPISPVKGKKGKSKSIPLIDDQPPRQALLSLSINIPNFPSQHLASILDISTSLDTLFAHFTSEFNYISSLFSESYNAFSSFLSRFVDHPSSPSRTSSPQIRVELQFLLLLTTGRFPNTHIHEQFGSKLTERTFEKLEMVYIAALERGREVVGKSLIPVMERTMLELEGLRVLWMDERKRNVRGGAGKEEVKKVERLIIVIRVVIKRLYQLEALAAEELLVFREFASWIKYELEKVQMTEAQTDSKLLPRFNLLSVSNYIGKMLPCYVSLNPGVERESALQKCMRVEKEEVMDGFFEQKAFEEWIEEIRIAEEAENVKKHGEQELEKVIRKLEDTVLQEREEEEEEEMLFELESDRLFASRRSSKQSVIAPASSSNMQKTSSSSSSSSKSRRTSVLPSTSPSHPLEEFHNLPIAHYIHHLSSHLSTFLSTLLSSTISSTTSEIGNVVKVLEWNPQDREEEDALALLGLARDPTKLATRFVENTEEGVAKRWLAFVSEGKVLENQQEESLFWIASINQSTGQMETAKFPLVAIVQLPENGTFTETATEVLDIEFFDDEKLILLLRFSASDNLAPRHALGIVPYPSLTLSPCSTINSFYLNPPSTPESPTIPLSRLHYFDPPFVPLQFAFNGREGRKIGCVLGGEGKELLVLDMDDENEEEEEENCDEVMKAEDEQSSYRDEASGSMDVQNHFDATLEEQGYQEQDDSDLFASINGEGDGIPF